MEPGLQGGGSGSSGPAAGPPGAWRDWGNRLGAKLPVEVLAKVLAKVVAGNEAEWAEYAATDLRNRAWSERYIQDRMARKREGHGLFAFAMVCKAWRKAQLRVGKSLRTRADSDVILPGRVALVKWALAEGCPRERADGWDMAHMVANTNNKANLAHVAASYGHTELVRWLCGEGGFAMDEVVMRGAAGSGNLELVQWLRAEGCPWNSWTSQDAALNGQVEVLRWARANGCPWVGGPWNTWTRHRAEEKHGYTDNFPY